MTGPIVPVAGRFYRDLHRDTEFEVLGVDEEDGQIEVQYRDGDIEVIDPETWAAFDLAPVEPVRSRERHQHE